MWYKDELHESHTYSTISEDLCHWEVLGPEITDCAHEGPNVFWFQNAYWMTTDPWNGIGVYKSDDAGFWTRCPDILDKPGKRTDDGVVGSHADVLVTGEHAYIFYFTHPEKIGEKRPEDPMAEYRWNRSSIQVAQLQVRDGILVCDRDVVELELPV